jgi:hypothetical protein
VTERQRLPSFRGIGVAVGGFLVGLEQALLQRRPPAAVIRQQDEPNRTRTVRDVTLELPEESDVPRRRPPPDDSGARL